MAPVRTLAIDCATEACSAALFADHELVDGRFETLGRGHAERLVPMIAELPDRGHADRILVALGPGSFTGVRVGLAAARALALAWGAEIAGYGTLALQAAQGREALGSVPITVCNRAGHGEWFVQNFTADGIADAPPRSLRPDRVSTICENVVGSEAEALVARAGRGTAHALLPDARKAMLLPSSDLTAHVAPIYGRAPDARPTAR